MGELFKLIIVVILLIILIPLLWCLVKLLVFFIGNLIFSGLGYALLSVVFIIIIVVCLKSLCD